MPLVLTGATSGSTTLQSTDAVTNRLTLPASTGTLLTTTGDGSGLTGIPAPAALTTASGSAPSYSARAWVNFNGTGVVAIRDSENVSSITDNGTGDYTVNFTTAMTDANYAVNATGKWASGNEGEVTVYNDTTTILTTAVRIMNGVPGDSGVSAISPRDSTYLFVSIFR